MVTITLSIGGIDRSSFYHTSEYDDPTIYKNSSATITIVDDASHTIATQLNISGKKTVILTVDAVDKFNGIVENFFPKEMGLIDIACIDKSIQMHGDLITVFDPSSGPASQKGSDIVEYLIDTFGGGLFTKSITATPASRTYTKIWRFFTALEIMVEIALAEKYSLRLTALLVGEFKPRTANDLGITYTEGTDFFNPNFPKIANRVFNKYILIDVDGQAYLKENSTSANNLFPRTKIIDDPDVTSEAEARLVLDSLTDFSSEELTPATIEVPQDFNLVGGGLIRINYVQLGFVNKQMFILNVLQSLISPVSTIELVNYSPDIDESLSLLLADRRQLQKRNIDNTLALLKLHDLDIIIGVKLELVIEKQTVATRRPWNEGSWNASPAWNFQSSTWTTVLSATIMTVMTRHLERIRDLYVGKAVTALDAANTTIEYGSGTTAATVTDSALETPIAGTDKAMDGGFPQDGPGAAENEHQASISDVDVTTFTANEVGLKEGSNLMARVVLDSSFSKAANETIRTRITETFSEVTS